MVRSSTSSDLQCPSANARMEGVHVLGVVDHSDDRVQISYLAEHLPATERILDQAAPAPVEAIFRLAAKCEESRCVHFGESRCRLADRIVSVLPKVTEIAPPCKIRSTCRWYRQKSVAACLRCPQITTLGDADNPSLMKVARLD